MLQINCIFGGDSMYSDVFAERIRTARQIKGETLQQVASGLNITNGTVSRYEMGWREPNLNQLGKFAKYYGVSTDWLLGLSEESNLAV